MIKCKIYLILLASFIAVLNLNAQNHTALWNQYYQDLQLKNRLHLMSDASLRSMDAAHIPYIFQIRSGINYELIAKQLAIESGLWYSTDHLHQQSELRPHWQVTYNQHIGASKLYFRWRNEHRFLTSTKQNHYVLRSRLFAGFRFKLTELGKSKKGLFAGSEQELLLNLAGDQKFQDLDQYRIINYVGLRFSPSMEFSLNYFMLYRKNPIKDLNNFQSIIWLKIRHTIGSQKG